MHIFIPSGGEWHKPPRALRPQFGPNALQMHILLPLILQIICKTTSKSLIIRYSQEPLILQDWFKHVFKMYMKFLPASEVTTHGGIEMCILLLLLPVLLLLLLLLLLLSDWMLQKLLRQIQFKLCTKSYRCVNGANNETESVLYILLFIVAVCWNKMMMMNRTN